MGEDSFDRNRPNVQAKCPFCGGQYTAGYLTDSAMAYERKANPGQEVSVFRIEHTSPPCVKFLFLPAREFLQEARLAGANIHRIGEDN
jgi:hypothetical protein